MPCLYLQFITIGGCSPVLPYDSMVNRLTSASLPYYCCFSLIGDAYACNLFHADIGFGYRFCHSTKLRTPYFVSIMLNPSGLWKYLFEFFLCHTDNISMMIKDHTAAAGSALVKSKNELRRHESFRVFNL